MTKKANRWQQLMNLDIEPRETDLAEIEKDNLADNLFLFPFSVKPARYAGTLDPEPETDTENELME